MVGWLALKLSLFLFYFLLFVGSSLPDHICKKASGKPETRHTVQNNLITGQSEGIATWTRIYTRVCNICNASGSVHTL